MGIYINNEYDLCVYHLIFFLIAPKGTIWNVPLLLAVITYKCLSWNHSHTCSIQCHIVCDPVKVHYMLRIIHYYGNAITFSCFCMFDKKASTLLSLPLVAVVFQATQIKHLSMWWVGFNATESYYKLVYCTVLPFDATKVHSVCESQPSGELNPGCCPERMCAIHSAKEIAVSQWLEQLIIRHRQPKLSSLNGCLISRQYIYRYSLYN